MLGAMIVHPDREFGAGGPCEVRWYGVVRHVSMKYLWQPRQTYTECTPLWQLEPSQKWR